MKKLLILLAVAASFQTVSAQTVVDSKTTDNWYLGVKLGGEVKTRHTAFFQHINPTVGVRVGRNFTPVFGLAAEGIVTTGNQPWHTTGTFLQRLNVNALATVNFTNWILGYKGKPRAFEVIGIAGFGWAHRFGNHAAVNWENDMPRYNVYVPAGDGHWDAFKKVDRDFVSNKVGLDLAYNFGSDKQFQVYLEPAYNWALNDGNGKIKWHNNHAYMSLEVGFNYRFANSNGTHNFKLAEGRDQSEIDALNARINKLRAQLDDEAQANSRLKGEISVLKAKLEDCLNRAPEIKYIEKPSTNTTTTTKKNSLVNNVHFRIGKTVIDASQVPNVERVAAYLKKHPKATVEVLGYASKDGNYESNVKLAEGRAQAVKTMLVNKYNIAASRIDAKGKGISEAYEEPEWNRVSECTIITDDVTTTTTR